MNDKRVERNRRIYALYEGENNVCDGTLGQIQRRTGIPMNYLIWMTYKSSYERFVSGRCKRGLVLIDNSI